MLQESFSKDKRNLRSIFCFLPILLLSVEVFRGYVLQFQLLVQG